MARPTADTRAVAISGTGADHSTGLVDQHFLCGALNSYVVNYLARLRITTHAATAIMEGLPIPRPVRARQIARGVATLARRLSAGGGHQARSEARLQALVASLYRLAVNEFRHILSTFPLVDAEDRTRALNEFRRLNNA